jgi:hypothetical protein
MTNEIAKHIDLSEVVENDFAQTGKLRPEISGLDPDVIRELIDAVPDLNKELIQALRDVLRWEGVCITL